MRKGQQKLSEFRKRLSQYLESLGYECFRRDKMKASDKWFCHAETPEVDAEFLVRDLRVINQSEVFCYGEGLAVDIASLPLQSKPDGYCPVEIGKTIAEFRTGLTTGVEFGYPNPYRETNDKGEVDWVYDYMKLVDRQNIGHNRFCAVERWRGRVDADFLWDYVICVNCLPLVTVAIEPDEKGDADCQRAYDAMRRELDEDYVLRAYVQFCVISNGVTTLVGSPVDSLENFKTWPSLMGEEPPVGFSVPAETAFVSLLRPDRLLDVLQNNIYIKYEENGRFDHFFGDYHQYFAILKIEEAMRAHFAKSDEPFCGYVDLLKSESGISNKLSNQAITCIWLSSLRLEYALMEVDDKNRQWVGFSSEITDEDIDDLHKTNDPKFFLFGPEFTFADYQRVVKEFPDASVVYFRQVPMDDEPFGECIYKASFSIC